MQSIQSGSYQSVIFKSGLQQRAITQCKDINSDTDWCDGLMVKSDERNAPQQQGSKQKQSS